MLEECANIFLDFLKPKIFLKTVSNTSGLKKAEKNRRTTKS